MHIRISRIILTLICALTLTACGGGGGGGSAPTAPTKAILKINLTGTLPTNFAMSGLGMTVTLPANVTPELANGVVATSVVAASGTYAGGAPTTPVYVAASGNSLATLQLALANAVPSGVTTVGEVATVTVLLAGGAVPTTSSFVISNVTVIDTLGNSNSTAMGATVASVSLQ
jgi:hypothetical protein